MGDVKTLIPLLLALPLSAATLVRDGKSGYSVCVAGNAIAAEQHAAQEFVAAVEQMSGARLPVTTACDSAKTRYVFIGQSSASDRAFRGAMPAALGTEEFVLKASGRNLLIAGGRPRGTLYGVYTLLDRLGCRWYTRDVSRIPKLRTIELGNLNERGKPAFEYREPFFTEAFDKTWAARNRTNGNAQYLDASVGGKVEYFPFVHSFYSLLPPEKYFKDHPEYFSLIDGARRVERGQLCLTNPDVLRIAVEQVRQWIRERPTVGILSVSQNDWEGWCECDRCRRVEQEEGGEHSGPILRFVNAVAAEIAKTNPDKLIDTLAYWYTENPPAKVRPLPNVRIRLCPIGVCVSHPYAQCPRSAYFLKNLKAWGAITNQLYIWHYNTNFSHYLAPMPDFDELAADLPLYQRNGVVGIFLEGAYPKGGGGENAELRSYIMARLLWDPRTDVNREVNEFLDAVYGRAAKPLRSYYDLLHRQVRTPPAGLGQHLWIFNLPSFSPSFYTQSDRLFAEAMSAADNDAVRGRVERARLPLDYMRVMAAREYSIQGDTFAPGDLAGIKEQFLQFTARLRRFGMDSIAEGRALTADEKYVAGLEAWPVIGLENEFWRVSVMPQLGGRILRMTDKRSGREMLRIAGVGEREYPNVAGQLVQAYPDYPLRAWESAWTGERVSPTEALLHGRCPNGLTIERRIRLDGPWVRTEAEAENNTGDPLQVTLQTRADLEPDDIDRARVALPAERLLIRPEEQPTGSETLKGAGVPNGEWSLRRAGAPEIVNRFDRGLAERTTYSWNAKGWPRVTLGVWSKRKTLAPGERLRIDADYSVR